MASAQLEDFVVLFQFVGSGIQGVAVIRLEITFLHVVCMLSSGSRTNRRTDLSEIISQGTSSCSFHGHGCHATFHILEACIMRLDRGTQIIGS